MIQVQLKENEAIAVVGDLHMDSQTPSSRIDDIQETLIDKLEDMRVKCIERNVKHVFFLGDIFNRIACPHTCVNLLGEKFLDFKKSGMELYSILGNHDIVRNSLEAMEKSPIQTLFSFGVLTHINTGNPVIINDDTLITPVDYTEEIPEANKDFKYNILLAHAFYDMGKLLDDGKHNIRGEDVKKLHYNMMFLGHDHEEYPVQVNSGTIIVRSGSILRGTSHNYNFTRKPKFIVLHNLNNITRDSIEEVELRHKEYKDIASEYVLNKKRFDSYSGLQDVLSNLAEKLSSVDENEEDRIYEIIKSDSKLPNDCRTLLLKYIGENV